MKIPGKHPASFGSRCPARAFRISERVLACSRCPPSSPAVGSEELGAKSSPLDRSRVSVGVGEIFSRRSGAAIPLPRASVTRPRPGWGFRAKSRCVCAKELEGGKSEPGTELRASPLGLCFQSPASSPFNFFFFLLSFNLISSNSTFVVTVVTPGSANPLLAISLSKKAWPALRKQAASAAPHPGGYGDPRGELRIPDLRQDLQPGICQSNLPYSTIQQVWGGKGWACTVF